MHHRALSFFVGLSSVILIGWLLKALMFVTLPAVIAAFIAFLLSPLVSFMTRRRVPHVVASSLAVILTVMAIYLVGVIILNSLVSFQEQFPNYEARINEMISRFENLDRLELGPISQERLRQELGRLSLSSVVGSILNSFFTFLTYLLFTLVFAIFFLLGSARLPGKIELAFKPEQAAKINQAVDSISRQVQGYIWAKTVTSLITGLSMTLACLGFGVDFPITWGFFTFLLNFIPTVGVIAASIMPPLVHLVQYGHLATTLWLIFVLAAVFISLGNIVEPWILGDSVNISPLVALLSLIFWGWLWGPAGMIVAVPVTASIKFSCDHLDGLKPIGVMMGRGR
ncbi:MAG: AI-2E family transporter [Pseudomonadota bacterium]